MPRTVRSVLCFLLMLLALSSQTVIAQEQPQEYSFTYKPFAVNVSVGETSLNMLSVNGTLDSLKDYYLSTTITPKPQLPNLTPISNGLFIEAEGDYSLGNDFLGIGADYLSASGGISVTTTSATYGYMKQEHDFNLSAFEVFALLGTRNVARSGLLGYFFEFGAGLGFASGTLSRTDLDFIPHNPAPPYDSLAIFSDYFAAKVRGGASLFLGPNSLNVSLGYRWANAGYMHSDPTPGVGNYVYNTDLGTRAFYTKAPVSFDFSGFYATGGFTFAF